MIILFMLFLIQFSIACSCLAVNSGQQQQFAEEGWNRVPESIKAEVQDTFICCGFNQTTMAGGDNHPTCDKVTVRIKRIKKSPILLTNFAYVLAFMLPGQFTVGMRLSAMHAKIGRHH